MYNWGQNKCYSNYIRMCLQYDLSTPKHDSVTHKGVLNPRFRTIALHNWNLKNAILPVYSTFKWLWQSLSFILRSKTIISWATSLKKLVWAKPYVLTEVHSLSLFSFPHLALTKNGAWATFCGCSVRVYPLAKVMIAQRRRGPVWEWRGRYCSNQAHLLFRSD